jgi:hypothetical protein
VSPSLLALQQSDDHGSSIFLSLVLPFVHSHRKMGVLWKGAGARTVRTLVLVGLLGPAAAHRTVPHLGRGGGALPSNGLKVLTVLRDSRNTHPRLPLTRLCHFCALRGGGTEARDELRGESQPDGPAWRARFSCSARARAIPSFVKFLSRRAVLPAPKPGPARTGRQLKGSAGKDAPPGDREWDYRMSRPERDGGRARRAQPGAAHSRRPGAAKDDSAAEDSAAEDSDHRGEAEEMRQSSQSQTTRKRRKAASPPPDNLQSESSDGGRDAASLSSSDGRALSSFLSEDQGASAEGNARFWSVNLRPPDSVSVSRARERARALFSLLSLALALSLACPFSRSLASLSLSLSPRSLALPLCFVLSRALSLALSRSCALARYRQYLRGHIRERELKQEQRQHPTLRQEQ